MMNGFVEFPDPGSTPGPAFDWVAQELILPDEPTRQALRATFMQYWNHGTRKLASELAESWGPGVRWPSGEAYLRAQAALPDDERDDDASYTGNALLMLLALRLGRVAQRLFRDVQVRAVIHPQSPTRVSRYTHVCINRHHAQRNACGIAPNAVISIPAGLLFLRQPAHDHPACNCTADPYPVGSQRREGSRP